MTLPKNNQIYHLERHREYHSGLYAMPMSEGPPVVVRLHGAFEKHRTPFKLQCTNQMPDIPAPSINESGVEFLSGVICGQTPDQMENWTSYVVTGEYEFINTQPEGIAADMDIGICPSDIRIAYPAAIKKGDFKNVIDGSGSTFVQQ